METDFKDFKRGFGQDLKDIYHFYLDKESKARLASMRPFKRWLFIVFWTVKSLFKKLSPVRRLLLIVSLVLLFQFGYSGPDGRVIINFQFIGFLLLLFILALELKDKLLARDELQAGRVVQQALTPDASPKIPGWDVWLFSRPALEVGGDLVDFHPLNNHRISFALGDVAGKGLPAALLMARLQAVVRMLAPDFDSLSRLGHRLNEVFCRDCLPTRFATLVYLIMDQTSGKVRLLNAGHLPPLHWKEGQVHELQQGGAALGLTPKARYKEQTVHLNEGDVLLVFSDGVTEARDKKGGFFGDERVASILKNKAHFSAEALGEHIIGEVEGFVDGAPVSDDLSLVIIRRKKKE